MKRKAESPSPSPLEADVAAQVVQAASELFGLELHRRNVGGFQNARGQYVKCGEAGELDYWADLQDKRRLELETKKASFDPTKISGKEKERFALQLARMRVVNAQGNVAFWVRDSTHFVTAMQHILAGCRVEIDEDGFCFVTDEPEEPHGDQPSPPQ
jgi:hypothetical protein